MPMMSYIGSKKSLLPMLEHVIKPLIRKPNTTFCDFFLGSGCVSNHFKNVPGIARIIAGDLELYSYVFGKALLNVPYSYKLAMLIDQLNLLAATAAGLVERNFAQDGKLFFSKENAQRIDGMRLAISKLYHAGAITYPEFIFLLASLLVSSSAVSNTCGTFRAHLKQLNCRAKKKFKLIPVHHDKKIFSKNIVKRKNAIEMASRFHADIIYLDPPYNSCHYGAYYSFLNYLCAYDGHLKLNGTGILENYNKSKFGLAKQAMVEFRTLFAGIKANFVVLSYSSKGIITIEDMTHMLMEKGSVHLYKIWYKAYKSKKEPAKRGHVIEYIIVLDCNAPKGRIKKTWLKL